MSDGPATIYDLDKKLDILINAVNKDFDANKEFKSRTESRIDKLEARVESQRDRYIATEKAQTERIYTIEKVQAENSTILASVQAIKGQVMRITVSGFFGIFGVVTIAGSMVAYFLKG